MSRRSAARLRRGAAILLAGLALAGPADARPLTLEDLLQREALGAVRLDPSGRWLVLERRGPYAAGGRFDLEQADSLMPTRLLRVDLRHPGPPVPLVPAEPGVGYAAGALSPDGARMLVYRLSANDWELGVVTLADRKLRWLGVTPERVAFAQSAAWLSPTRIAVIARPRGDLPFVLRWRRNAALQLPARWAASAQGGTAATVVGSGRYRDQRPQPAAREVLVLDLARDARRTVARGAFVDLAASRDGRRLALLAAGPDLPLRPSEPVQGDHGLALTSHRLALVDLLTGAVTRPAAGWDLLTSPLAWSPDSGELLAYGRRPGAPWTSGRLLRVDARSGAVHAAPEVIPALSWRPEAVSADWLGAQPVVWGRTVPRDRDDWWLLTPRGPRALTAGLRGPSADDLTLGRHGAWLATDHTLWRVTADGRRTRLARIDGSASAALEALAQDAPFAVRHAPAWIGRTAPAAGVLIATEDSRLHIEPSPSPGGDLLAADLQGRGQLVRQRQGGAVQVLWRDRGGAATPLMTLSPQLADVDAAEVRPVRHSGPDHQPLTSWLMLPPPRKPGAAPPPLIVWPYLGYSYPTFPTWMTLEDPDLNEMPALLAAHGYAVLLPSLPLRTDGGDPVDGLADRVLAIVDAAIADPALAGTFDPTRLGVWGHSYGGYTTYALLTQTARFRAAVAYAGMSDLVSMWGEFQPALRIDPSEGLSPRYAAGWVEDVQGEMHAPPWTDPKRYLRNSPVLHAGRIATPLLILHGDQDSVPLGQAEEMFSALYRQDKDAELVTYWGEGHVIRSPGNLRDLYARVFGWFDDWLTGPTTGAAAGPSAGPPPVPASSAPTPRAPPRPGSY